VRYRFLIFDFDGTLADSFPIFLENIGEVMTRFGLPPIDEKSLEELRGRSAKEIMDHLGLPAWKLPLLAREMRKRFAANATRTSLFPGIPGMLRQLTEAGCTLAIVSSNSEANIRAILGAESELISVYACGASLFGKSSKFRRVLKKTGIPAAQTLAIGDELRDIDAAREIPIDFAAVCWGYTRASALEARSPKFIVHSVEEIARLLFY
jgi:phosphoglycolate phosphatase